MTRPTTIRVTLPPGLRTRINRLRQKATVPAWCAKVIEAAVNAAEVPGPAIRSIKDRPRKPVAAKFPANEPPDDPPDVLLDEWVNSPLPTSLPPPLADGDHDQLIAEARANVKARVLALAERSEVWATPVGGSSVKLRRNGYALVHASGDTYCSVVSLADTAGDGDAEVEFLNDIVTSPPDDAPPPESDTEDEVLS